MALKDSWQNLKGYFTSNEAEDYDDDEMYEDEEENTSYAGTQPAAPSSSSFRPAKSGGYNTVAQRPVAMKVVIVEPKVFEDSENITNQLRDMRPVVINFEQTDPHEAARIVDFVSGATFALDGKLEKIGKDIFICVPTNISVDYNGRSYGDLAEKFTWKEPAL